MTAHDALAQAEETLLLAHLKRILHADHGPKTFCGAELWGPRWRIADCRLGAGHEGPHVDCHQAITWTRKKP